MSSSSAASRSGDGQLLLRLELAAELLVLALEQLAAAQPVDGAVLRGGHQPGARVVRDARLRPLLERGDERVLRQLLGEADVAHDPRERRRSASADSIRQTASIARWVSVAVTATDHTIVASAQAGCTPPPPASRC